MHTSPKESQPLPKQPAAIPVEEVAKFPPPGMAVPVSFAFSPDDRSLSYLYGPNQSRVRQLYEMDAETGEKRVIQASVEPESAELSLEEQLLRQRQRQMGEGITRYSRGEKRDFILIPSQSGVYLKEGADAAPRMVASADAGAIITPQASPDWTRLAFVRDSEIYIAPMDGESPPRQLTFGARESGETNGVAEYIAQEEMGRLSGFWWSKDGSLIAFERADETHIPAYRIEHQGKDAVGESAREEHRYPFAGEANARVALGVVSADGGEPAWMDLGESDDIYLARVAWTPSGALTAQLQNREQTRLDLVEFNPSTGARTAILTETSDVWINLHDMHKPLKSGEFIWASERGGFNHLYLYGGGGNLIRQLTAGDWVVDGLAGVDESARIAYFTGTKDGATERHLYRVSLDGGEIERITRESGVHSVTLDHRFQRFVDVFSDVNSPPTAALRSLEDGAILHIVHAPDDPRLETLDLAPPELTTVESEDGDTLHAALYRPPPSFGEGPHPTVIYVYGGPHAQVVTNSWAMTCAMRVQRLRSLGYLVFALDNRGSARRGLAFEGAIRHNMGDLEVRDQMAGVRRLVERRLADPNRVGVYGWSYGGYMALMCLTRAPGMFRMAVAGAPVTHWDGYDTHYTERYMGTPQSNPAGYAASSPMAHIENLRGGLLIVHGLIDENVHFRHTARLINALTKARKPYELLMFPDERHMPRSLADRVYMEERIGDFFERNL